MSFSDCLKRECFFNVQEVDLAKQRLVGNVENFYMRINEATGCLDLLDFKFIPVRHSKYLKIFLSFFY